MQLNKAVYVMVSPVVSEMLTKHKRMVKDGSNFSRKRAWTILYTQPSAECGYTICIYGVTMNLTRKPIYSNSCTDKHVCGALSNVQRPFASMLKLGGVVLSTHEWRSNPSIRTVICHSLLKVFSISSFTLQHRNHAYKWISEMIRSRVHACMVTFSTWITNSRHKNAVGLLMFRLLKWNSRNMFPYEKSHFPFNWVS